MRIKFRNYPGEGPLIECDGYTYRVMNHYEGAAANAHRDIASMAMFFFGQTAATSEAIKHAMVTAIDHLRKQIEAAEVVEETGP